MIDGGPLLNTSEPSEERPTDVCQKCQNGEIPSPLFVIRSVRVSPRRQVHPFAFTSNFCALVSRSDAKILIAMVRPKDRVGVLLNSGRIGSGARWLRLDQASFQVPIRYSAESYRVCLSGGIDSTLNRLRCGGLDIAFNRKSWPGLPILPNTEPGGRSRPRTGEQKAPKCFEVMWHAPGNHLSEVNTIITSVV